jgi:hypothetical protein
VEVNSIQITKSPENDARVRLSALVSYETGAVREETYWFDVDESYGDFLSRSGNPWVVCLLPLAVALGEPLRVSAPVDRTLLRGVQEVMLVWKSWFPRLDPIRIHAEPMDQPAASRGARTGAFFSGGVDSFFTVLRHQNPAEDGTNRHIDDLISVCGLDIPLKNSPACYRINHRFTSVAESLGKTLVEVSTNLRTTRFNEANWSDTGPAAALSGTALVLEKRYKEVLIASTEDYANLMPLGSHPMTDPLFSSELCRIVHDGAAFNRAQKTEFIAPWEEARQALHVCWLHGDDLNCGACQKCHRTMATLEILGQLDRFATFGQRSLSPDELKRSLFLDASGPDFMPSIRELAVREGRLDFVRAVDYTAKRSQSVRRRLRMLEHLSHVRGFYRVSNRLKTIVVKDGISR